MNIASKLPEPAVPSVADRQVNSEKPPFLGFGLGLRAQHYDEILNGNPAIDSATWWEAWQVRNGKIFSGTSATRLSLGDQFTSSNTGGTKGNDRISKFSKDGKFIKSWGKHGSAPGEFDEPRPGWVNPEDVANDELAVVPPRRGHHALGLSDRGRQRLLDEDMGASLESSDREVGVRVGESVN